MVFNVIFNNISVILWWSVSLGKETIVPKENQVSELPQVTKKTLSHNISSTPRNEWDSNLHNFSSDKH